MGDKLHVWVCGDEPCGTRGILPWGNTMDLDEMSHYLSSLVQFPLQEVLRRVTLVSNYKPIPQWATCDSLAPVDSGGESGPGLPAPPALPPPLPVDSFLFVIPAPLLAHNQAQHLTEAKSALTSLLALPQFAKRPCAVLIENSPLVTSARFGQRENGCVVSYSYSAQEVWNTILQGPQLVADGYNLHLIEAGRSPPNDATGEHAFQPSTSLQTNMYIIQLYHAVHPPAAQ